MSVIICPGIHDVKLTQDFLEVIQSQSLGHLAQKIQNEQLLVFPAQEYPAYSGIHIFHFLSEKLGSPNSLASPVVFISFSAGVVGAIGAAWMWQLLSGKVEAFIAVDGWGMPLSGNFPIHRISHDYFTHWSSMLLGTGGDSFYADPPVEHLQLWRSPQTARGWWVCSVGGQPEQRIPTTAAQFLAEMLQRYGE